MAARFGTTPKLLVVDDDVDVFDWDDVLHTWATRCHPGRGIFVTHYSGHAEEADPLTSTSRSGAPSAGPRSPSTAPGRPRGTA